MIDENKRFDHEVIKKSISFFDLIKSLKIVDVKLTGIITTNYDLLIEYGLTSKGFNYGIPNQQL